MGTALDRVELRVLARSTAPDPTIAKPLDGELVAVVFDGVTPVVSASSEAFAAGLRNIANRQISSVDVMRVTDQCRLFIFQDEDPSLAARVLDPGALLRLIESGLPEAARASAQLGRNGVLAGVPRGDLLMVFVIDGGDLLAGATNLAANLATNYDEQVKGALSPWMYWVRDGRVEEMRYELDAAGDVEAINFPDPLLPLLPQ